LGAIGPPFYWDKNMRDIFAFLPDTKYCFVLANGDKITGTVSDIFDNGIEVQGYRIPQDKITYWYEVE